MHPADCSFRSSSYSAFASERLKLAIESRRLASQESVAPFADDSDRAIAACLQQLLEGIRSIVLVISVDLNPQALLSAV